MPRSRAAAVFALLLSAGCVRPLADHPPEVSLGGPARGYVLGAGHLPNRGAGFEVFRTGAQGGHLYGTRRLIDAIQLAAGYVSHRAPGGAPLRVGDLSERRGGTLVPRHHSHRNGRDADLIFFALDAHGRSVPAPGFTAYNARGEARDPTVGLRFDTARNWLLVESLVRAEQDGVVRIFVYSPLRTLLLDWARAHGRDPELIARAEWVLRQPSDSAPHNDHFHVRVACTPDERALGCQDGAPLWWWLEREFGKGDSAPCDDAILTASIASSPRATPRPSALATAGEPRPLDPALRLHGLRSPLAAVARDEHEP